MPEQLPPATFTVVDRGDVRIHTCTAPEAFLANSTHVVETVNALVVVDGQFVVPYARAFRSYLDGLGKPIDRVYLSHAHVDHFFGLGAAFADVPVHAPAATIATLERDGEALRVERAAQYGPLVPDRIVVPQHPVTAGVATVDGVKYEFDLVTAAECDTQLVIRLPDLGVTVAQDLLYSGAHAYVTPDTAGWMSALETLAESGSTLFLAGHGPAADVAEVRRAAEYLAFAQQALATAAGPEEFKAALLARYPERTGAVILDICAPRLFAGSGADRTAPHRPPSTRETQES